MPAIALRAASLVDVEFRLPRCLQVLARTRDPRPNAREHRLLELTSRGDRVPISLWLPTAPVPAPLVCLQPGAGESGDAGHLLAIDELISVGLAVATLDWPLRGRRASVKLSERLIEALAADAADPNDAPLIEQFILQSVVDLAHTVETLAEMPEIRGDRICLSGVGIAAHLVALLGSISPRPAALCLAPTRQPRVEHDLPLSALVGAGRKRPVLLLARKNAAEVPPEELEALRLACPGPADLERIAGRIDPLDREGVRHVARFVSRTFR